MEHWACHVAQQLRTAVSHLRRMRLNPTLRRQRLSSCTPQEQDALNGLLDLIVADADEEGSVSVEGLGDEISAVEPPTAGPAAEDDPSGPPAEVGTSLQRPRRALAKRLSEASAASLDFERLAFSPQRHVVMSPQDCGLLLNALAMRPRPAETGSHGATTRRAKEVLRRPAASPKTKAAAPSARTGGSQHIRMYYSTSGAVAVRQRGGKQLLQILVGGASRAALEQIADQAIAKLEAGESLVTVK